MTALALALLTFAGVPAGKRQSVAEDVVIAARRYALSALGPVSISAVHFIAALIFLHTLSRAEFGVFSFLLVVAPFCMSVSGAMFAPPIARQAARSCGISDADRLTLFKASMVFSALASAAVALLMRFGGAALPLAAVFGLYAGLMGVRWFARCWTYA